MHCSSNMWSDYWKNHFLNCDLGCRVNQRRWPDQHWEGHETIGWIAEAILGSVWISQPKKQVVGFRDWYSVTESVFRIFNLHVAQITKSFIKGGFKRGISAKFKLQWKTPCPDSSQDPPYAPEDKVPVNWTLEWACVLTSGFFNNPRILVTGGTTD